MSYNGHKSIANISISNPGFAGNILLLRGEIESSCTECKLPRIEHIPVFTYTPALLLVFFGWLSITPLVKGGFMALLSSSCAAATSEAADLMYFAFSLWSVWCV